MYVSCHTSASQICPTQPVLRLRSIWKSNILSQSLDVQQKSQNTRTHWSRIDTQLGVSLMSRKAVFSIFLFNTNSSSSIQIKQRWQWEGTPSSSCLFSSASHCSRAAWLQFLFFLFLLVESKQASWWPLNSDPYSEMSASLRDNFFLAEVAIKKTHSQMVIYLNIWTSIYKAIMLNGLCTIL